MYQDILIWLHEFEILIPNQLPYFFYFESFKLLHHMFMCCQMEKNVHWIFWKAISWPHPHPPPPKKIKKNKWYWKKLLRYIIIYTQLYDCLCQKTKIRMKRKKDGKKKSAVCCTFFSIEVTYSVCYLFLVFCVHCLFSAQSYWYVY